MVSIYLVELLDECNPSKVCAQDYAKIKVGDLPQKKQRATVIKDNLFWRKRQTVIR